MPTTALVDHCTLGTPMPKDYQLADLQLAIMQVLWAKGEATVGDVHASLYDERKLAYTTIGTMLAKMEEKNYVTHRSVQRQNVYKAAIKQEKVNQSMVNDLVKRLFHGDITEMVSQLLGSSSVSPEVIVSLKKLIRQREQELNDE